ncbi:MAG TPA: peptide MFS transporter, partial [Sphingomonadales bacterium]|nr:peptide MFS transporter [Sphingomonadales bacterium]
MWERWGYYGMRALLILYLTQFFLFPDEVGNRLYGAFTSLVYLTPLIGGLIADKFFGSKKSVKLGALFMCVGYALLAVTGAMDRATPTFEYQGARYEVSIVENGEVKNQYVMTEAGEYRIRGNPEGGIILEGSDGSVLPEKIPAGEYKADAERNPLHLHLMFIALSLIIVGNGYFKPNISTIVGTLYAQGDRRRDAGFTIFYMGINLGSVISQFFSPLFAVWFGWWAGFGLAAFGMFLAFIIFSRGADTELAGRGEIPDPARLKTPVFAGLTRTALIYLFSFLAVPVVWGLVYETQLAAYAAMAATEASSGLVEAFMSQSLVGKTLSIVSVLVVVGIPYYSFKYCDKVERDRMIVAVVLTIFSVLFWSLFEQAGSSLTLYAERNTDRVFDSLGGYVMPAGQTQIFNPFFIVMLAPLFSMMWVWLAKRGWEPSIPVKFALALMQLGLGFLVLVFGASFADSTAQVAMVWLALAYLLHSTGELCLSPVGLSMITKLSVARLVGLMMGVWFLSSSFAQYVGGWIAALAATETVGGEVIDRAAALATYIGVFETVGLISIGVGLFLLAISPILKKAMHGVQ